jgi:hypothetical protein
MKMSRLPAKRLRNVYTEIKIASLDFENKLERKGVTLGLSALALPTTYFLRSHDSTHDSTWLFLIHGIAIEFPTFSSCLSRRFG